MNEILETLDQIADVVLAYLPLKKKKATKKAAIRQQPLAGTQIKSRRLALHQPKAER